MSTDTTPPGTPSSDAQPVDRWKPARLFPETYPGDHPGGHYLLSGDTVRPMHETVAGGFALRNPGGPEELDDHLVRLGLPGLSERYPVLAYGANRNPATLRIKTRNYGYRSPNGRDLRLPVLAATVAGADIAACALHGQGYFYGELLIDDRFTADTVLDVHVCLADREMVRVLNVSEGVAAGAYALAEVPGVRLADGSALVSALGYVAQAPVWSSPRYGSPVSFAASAAAGRGIPALSARGIMEHALDSLGLRGRVSELTGLADDSGLAAALAGYLNGQWWREFHEPGSADPGYRGTLAAFRARTEPGSAAPRTLDRLAARGRVLEADRADDLGPDHTWARLR